MKASKPCASGVLFVGASTLIAACGLVIDPDVLVAGNTDDADIARDAGGEGDRAGGGDGSGDTGFIEPSCKPTGAEVCDDGIDNDCNGRVDCADSACTDGFACVEPPPDGWTPILLAEDARPNCPAGYAAPTDVRVVQGDGAIACACNCGSNCSTTITLTRGNDLACMVGSGTETFQANATNCTGKSFDLPSGSAKATSGSGTCAANDTPTKSDPTNGRTCTPPVTAGAGCQAAQRCLPKTTGFATCVAKAGAHACPTTAFTKQRRTGTTANDQRACTGCSCNSNPCDVALEVWSHPNCQGSANFKITSSCAANGTISNLKAYKSKVTSGCTEATPSTPQGAITFANEQTICCN
jgi:Putative metal-binding motif